MHMISVVCSPDDGDKYDGSDEQQNLAEDQLVLLVGSEFPGNTREKKKKEKRAAKTFRYGYRTEQTRRLSDVASALPFDLLCFVCFSDRVQCVICSNAQTTKNRASSVGGTYR